ncbi:CvpA family protein [Flavobacteriales bacterium]|nr:CvpA family protein [Flavobacteriales bacterium]
MNYIDIIISVSLLYGLIKGFSNGIIKEITNIVSLVLAIYIGIHFSGLIEPHLQSDIINDYERAIPLLAFLLVFIIILIIIKSIGELIDRVTKLLALGVVSRLLGAIFGVFKIIVIFSGILFFLTEYKIIDPQIEKESILLSPIQDGSEILMPKINRHKEIIIETTKENTKKAKEKIKKKLNFE